MKLGCICGTFNRSLDRGVMDQIRFLHRCAADLTVQGVELQDIHFPQTRPAYLDLPRRTARDWASIVGVGVHNDFGRGDPTCARARLPRSSSGRWRISPDTRECGLAWKTTTAGAFTPTAEEFLRVLREVGSAFLVPLLDTGTFTDGCPSVQRVVGVAEHVHAKSWKVAQDGSDEKVD